MRQQAKKSEPDRLQVMGMLYGRLLSEVEGVADTTDYICLAHSFNENRWKQLFTDVFGGQVVFVFVTADKHEQTKRLFDREAKDIANYNRSSSELIKVMQLHIANSDRWREHPETYITVKNNFDISTLNKAIIRLKEHL